MNEIEFLVRRILKEGYEYAEKQKEEKSKNPAFTLYRYTAQIQLLNHLERQFLEGNLYDEQD
jgi:hypothetical protein